MNRWMFWTAWVSLRWSLQLSLRLGLPVLMLALSIVGFAAPGQPITAPFTGPVVALDTVEQDRILLYDLGTKTVREFTLGNRWHRVWGFSPDGCRLLVTLSDGFAPAKLYTVRLDGSDLRELVRYTALPADQWGVWEPQWSPNPIDPRIAFTFIGTENGVTRHLIAWVSPQGGEPAFYSVSGDEHTARWSPDGQWLAYVSYETAPTPPDAPTPSPSSPAVREADLWVVNADASTKYRLTAFPSGSTSMPRWSPDGELIGFVFSPSANNDQFWMIGNTPDAIPTQLSYAQTLALDLTWLPDSTAMLAAARELQNVTENRLWRIPLVGNADVDATQYLSDPDLAYTDYPRFSADGRWLAFRSAYETVILDQQTGASTFLDTFGNTPPVWSPAGFAGESQCSA